MVFKYLLNIIILICIGTYKYIFLSSFFINILFFIYILFITYHLFVRNSNKILKKIIEICLAIGIIFFIISLGTILIDIQNYKGLESKNKYVIILGAGLQGDKPKNVLKYRLDKAIDYYNKYPNTIFIVSGGQGKDEIVSESEAMKYYLISFFIPKENIIEENKSTTTLENIIFSKKLVPNNIESIGIISNDFHMYRIKFFANKLSYKLNPIYASTPLLNKVSLFSREAIALVYYKIFSKKIIINRKLKGVNMLKTLNIFFLLFSISFSSNICNQLFLIENPDKLEYRDAANDNSNRILKEKNVLLVENDKLFNKLIILRGQEQKENVENLKINWLNYIKAKTIYKTFESEGRQAYCPLYNGILIEEIKKMNNFLKEELTMP